MEKPMEQGAPTKCHKYRTLTHVKQSKIKARISVLALAWFKSIFFISPLFINNTNEFRTKKRKHSSN